METSQEVASGQGIDWEDFSDDAGRSWKQSPIFGPPPRCPTKPEGFGEPAVVELADGKIWMVFRTRFGHLWQAWSADGGAHLGRQRLRGLVSPMSAVNAKRIPGTDAVIVLWNNAKPGTARLDDLPQPLDAADAAGLRRQQGQLPDLERLSVQTADLLAARGIRRKWNGDPRKGSEYTIVQENLRWTSN